MKIKILSVCGQASINNLLSSCGEGVLFEVELARIEASVCCLGTCGENSLLTLNSSLHGIKFGMFMLTRMFTLVA